MLLRSTDGEMLGKILILSHQMQDKREINITLIFLDAVPEKESVIIAYEDKDLNESNEQLATKPHISPYIL